MNILYPHRMQEIAFLEICANRLQMYQIRDEGAHLKAFYSGGVNWNNMNVQKSIMKRRVKLKHTAWFIVYLNKYSYINRHAYILQKKSETDNKVFISDLKLQFSFVS